MLNIVSLTDSGSFSNSVQSPRTTLSASTSCDSCSGMLVSHPFALSAELIPAISQSLNASNDGLLSAILLVASAIFSQASVNFAPSFSSVWIRFTEISQFIFTFTKLALTLFFILSCCCICPLNPSRPFALQRTI